VADQQDSKVRSCARASKSQARMPPVDSGRNLSMNGPQNIMSLMEATGQAGRPTDVRAHALNSRKIGLLHA
jgi:hypothetical protein